MGYFQSVEGHLTEVEGLMRALVRGERDEKAGQIVNEHLATGGKRLRARLALAAVQCLGGDPKGALGWAAACELLHNATLIHDDLQDGDRLRRGQPTSWVRHGMPQAVNAGDLIFVLPFAALEKTDIPAPARFDLCQILARKAADVIRGQAWELDLVRTANTDSDAYFHCIQGKTSALFELPVQGAAVLSGAGRSDAVSLSAPFSMLGMMFQIQDDVLDLFGDKGREARGSDLREGKISALVVEHVRLHPGDKDQLLRLLREDRDASSQQDVDAMIQRFEQGGALAATRDRIVGLCSEMRDAPALREQTGLREMMEELIELILRPIAHVVDGR